MDGFIFDRIYVLESLDETNEKLTGKELYDDLLRWKESSFDGKLKTELLQIENKQHFFNVLEYIKDECVTGGHHPILHFEIHGSNQKNGLVLKSMELITWDELRRFLIDLNCQIGNNLFLTLAVCHGAHLMQIMRIDQPAPFCGFIGSFETINSSDLLMRYNEFYTEFLSSLQLHTAFERLTNANPSMPSTYRFISAQDTFIKVYMNYLKTQTSEEGIQKRIQQVIQENHLSFSNRKDKRKFERDFKKRLVNTKEPYYREHSDLFFMLSKHPENRRRFNIPEKMNDFLQLYDNPN